MCALAPVPRIPPVATTPTTSRLVGPEPARPCVFGRPWPGKGQGRNTSICTAGAIFQESRPGYRRGFYPNTRTNILISL
jgi:hypothetical protein